MKVIILSASTGGGHMKVSNTIKTFFEKNDVSAYAVDTLEYVNHILNKTVTEGYRYSCTKFPSLYKFMYKNTNNKSPLFKVVYKINSLISSKLLPLIESYKPDIIITTHPFSTEMVSKLKSKNKISTPIICVMTDYAPHKTWINNNINAYIVANEDMKNTMIKLGVDKNIIHSYGIPIDGNFYAKRDKNIILKEMGLNDKLHTILIMGGTFGFKNMFKIYRNLLKINYEFQIIIITGKNKKLYENIENLVYNKRTPRNYELLRNQFEKYEKKFDEIKRVLKFGEKDSSELIKKETRIIYFTDEVDKYMCVSDLIITKPGGLTISEALAMNLPMAVFQAIPGQEEENAEFLLSKNMAIRLKPEETTNIIENLLKNKVKLESMKYSCENFDKSDCLSNILKLVKNMYQKMDV
ncbi:MAG: galactosyldiacylglycerol synthase [Candidatus Paraimprobicoccus trichonymphae]|uniref:Galactosyldiacylglycerol synthase n=1 Tax=Candidatus Paraimprobicoccus trichonymphae TaxID=3033793 RepID=A0AA48IH98_9FIRM|nr:MAG: galactosyldiacylglycerol synthase [Candidatus Paraimprobicoccus trichonymphae]